MSEAVEKIPDGPTVRLLQEVAKEHSMVIIVPIYEEEIAGVYYNTAAVIDADGKYLGKYRKNHIPHVNPGFWEKFYFRPGNLGYPTFQTAYAQIGVYALAVQEMTGQTPDTHLHYIRYVRTIHVEPETWQGVLASLDDDIAAALEED